MEEIQNIIKVYGFQDNGIGMKIGLMKLEIIV